jgi:uncharacterized protein (TIGR03435 family)
MRIARIGWVMGALLAASSMVSFAQTEKPSFEVASIRESKAVGPSSMNFPLNIGPQYPTQGGLLTARNVPLLQLFVFAYAKNMYQIQGMRAQLPEWARDMRFDVLARAEGNPTKDQMRAMMRGLLEERFGVKMRTELRQVQIYQLVLAKPGKMGPRLRAFSDTEAACSNEAPPWGQETAAPIAKIEGGFPAYCGAAVMMPGEEPGATKIGGRRLAMDDIATAVGGVGNIVDRPVLDSTGLTGTFDMMLEFAMDNPDPARAGLDMPLGPSLAAALKDQLGLKMESGKGSVEVVVLDRIQKPSDN